MTLGDLLVVFQFKSDTEVPIKAPEFVEFDHMQAKAILHPRSRNVVTAFPKVS
jgi:hypothetical protein